VTIDVLPDLALLVIFDFYMAEEEIEGWQTLVHVCRKWRNVVFGSPRRLNLRLRCTSRTQVRERLDVWPLLPIVVWDDGYNMRGEDNIIAALEHKDRICQLDLAYNPNSHLGILVTTQPFPALTCLALEAMDDSAPVVPDLFLGGSAPLLRSLFLHHIPFPGLPKLLLSATRLVSLHLDHIPRSGYISPEAMATGLSALTRLETLHIEFGSSYSRPHRPPPPLTRTLLPILTELCFEGVSEYLEDLVVQLDAPLLKTVLIIFFHQPIFDTPLLAQFISRTPKLKAHNETRVVFSKYEVSVTLPQTFDGSLELRISSRQSGQQLSSLVQVCRSSFPQALISAMEHLYVLDDGFSQLHWQDDVENSQWLDLFHPFTAVKDLYISREFTPLVVPALQELNGERVTEVLPALQTLFLEEPLPSGPVPEAIGQFVAARQLASHPVAVSRWERSK
jgi:hypothetical protein